MTLTNRFGNQSLTMKTLDVVHNKKGTILN